MPTKPATQAAKKSATKAPPKALPRSSKSSTRKPAVAAEAHVPGEPPRAKLRGVGGFVPGSLNDSISKLHVGESLPRCKRYSLSATDLQALSSEIQQYHNANNSVLSGAITRIRSLNDHKHKRFTIERGQYMAASNQALFVFAVVTRTE